MSASIDLFGNEIVGPVALSRDLLERGIAARLTGISSPQLVSMMYSDIDAIVDFGRLCRGDKAGQKISLLYNPHRFDTATVNGESIIQAFGRAEFSSGVARAIAFKDGLVRELLYQVLQLGINGVQYVNEFPPHVARDIYCTHDARTILDPCAGWGGRMIGAAAVGAFYHAFEPSTKTYAGLLRLGEFLKSFHTGFDFVIENTAFEDAELTQQYDLALTSPPYFDTEKYSDEPTQAAVRYKSFDSFCAGFYLPMICKAVKHATHGLVLNIGSRRYPMRQVVTDNFNTEAVTGLALSGSAGLGKEHTEGEVFLMVRKDK